MALTYEPIATNTLTTANNSITFSSISGSYTDLILVYTGSVNSTSEYMSLRFNGDTGSNYSDTVLYGDGSAAGSFRGSNQAYIDAGVVTNTTLQQTVIAHIQNYSNTTTNKTALIRHSSTLYQLWTIVGLWRSTAAINSVTMRTNGGANFNVGSTFTLYGIKAA